MQPVTFGQPFTYLVTDCHAHQSHTHLHFIYIVQNVRFATFWAQNPKNWTYIPKNWTRLKSLCNAPTPKFRSCRLSKYTNKQTHVQKNRFGWKHPLRYTMLRRRWIMMINTEIYRGPQSSSFVGNINSNCSAHPTFYIERPSILCRRSSCVEQSTFSYTCFYISHQLPSSTQHLPLSSELFSTIDTFCVTM